MADLKAMLVHGSECACSHEVENHQVPEEGRDAPKFRKLSQLPVIGKLGRFFSWWLVFFGIYASSSVCPFCGTPGCPVGAGAAGLVGGAFAVFWTYGRNLINGIKKFFRRFR